MTSVFLNIEIIIHWLIPVKATCYSLFLCPSEELSENIICDIISQCNISEEHKTISKNHGIHVSAVRNAIKKFAKHGTDKNFHGIGCKRKINERYFCRLVRTCKTSDDLKADQKQAGVIVSLYIIQCTLSEAECYREGQVIP